jgi:hypothetical protein
MVKGVMDAGKPMMQAAFIKTGTLSGGADRGAELETEAKRL